MSSPLSVGRIVIILGNLAYSIGAFIADFNETHVKNPRWPPHAKFHNGQTMSLGALLAVTSLYFLFRPSRSVDQSKDDLFTSVLIGTFYTGAALSAILYPGTAWQDPEFRQGGEQRYIFMAIFVSMWVGYFVERRNVDKLKAS